MKREHDAETGKHDDELVQVDDLEDDITEERVARRESLREEDHRLDQEAWDPSEDDEAIRDESPAWVDLWEIDAIYAQSAANGMADNTAKHAAIEAATHHAGARSGGPHRAPSPHDRARAAQRWEKNREYVESRYEDRDRRQ